MHYINRIIQLFVWALNDQKSQHDMEFEIKSSANQDEANGHIRLTSYVNRNRTQTNKVFLFSFQKLEAEIIMVQ